MLSCLFLYKNVTFTFITHSFSYSLVKDGKSSSASRGSQKALSLDIKNKGGGMDKNEDKEGKTMRFRPKICNKRRNLFYLK